MKVLLLWNLMLSRPSSRLRIQGAVRKVMNLERWDDGAEMGGSEL